MSINLTDELLAKTKKGKIASAKQVFLEGDQENLQQIGDKTHQLEDAIKDITISGGASTANAVSYNNETSGMTAITAQAAIDELATKNKSQDATIAEKAEKSDVQSSVSELKAKNTSQDAEIAKKANTADVTSQMQAEQSRVNTELGKKFDKESILQESGDAEDKVMSQKAVSDKINDLKGLVDKDISDNYPLSELHYYWKGGVNANLDEWTQVYHADRNTKAFTKIDISIYDSVEVSSIANGMSWSTSTVLYGGLHVFVNGVHKLVVNTPATYTIYPQQLKKKDDDVVVMLLTINADVTPKIVVNKSGLMEDKKNKITSIVLCGDSLCGNDSGLIVKEMKSILAKYSYSLVTRTMGGENMIGNLTRAGGLPIRAAEEFTIPADKTPTNIKLLSGWMNSKGVYVSNPYGSISDNPHNVIINGIDGNLQKIVAYGMCTYDGNKKFIKAYTSYPINLTTDSNVAYVRFCANDPQVGVTHITIGGEAKDVSTLLSLNGSLDDTGTYKENTAFKTSDFIAVSNSTIYADALAVSDTYSFKRSNDGVASKCGKYNIGYDAALYNDQDAVHIWFTGQNGGYDSEEEWADMIEQAARNFGEKFIVCSTALEGTTDALVYAAQKKFGKRYLNLRDYTQNQAVYDGQRFGLIDNSKTSADYSTLFWGSDRIHQNNLLSYLWAVKMWNMIIDFGWIEGDKVLSGDFYLS